MLCILSLVGVSQMAARRRPAPARAAQDVYWQVEDSADERRRQVRELHETIVELADFADETARLGAGLVVEIY